MTWPPLETSMSNNDIIALQTHYDQWAAKRFPHPKKGDNPFEYYCIEQFARPFDLSDSQLQSGMVGGFGDGGIDAFYVFANGELIDAETEIEPKDPPEFKILIIQSKSDEGFSPVEIDKLFWFTDDLLDLGRKKADYHSNYKSELIALMRIFKDKFGIVVAEAPPLSIKYVCIIKKDVQPTADAEKSVAKVRACCKKYIAQSKFSFKFANATELWKQITSRPPKKKILRWASQPMSTPEGEIGLVHLRDYYTFIRDGDKKIAERFFDSNVRGYWKASSINKKIAETLKDSKSPEFWLLNNGITILTDKVVRSSSFLEFEVHDPQIVNGLQTSRSIFHHFETQGNKGIDERRLLVRLIKSADKSTRDEVIRSTNSQNVMPEEALRATDKIHRHLETAFLGIGLYYDRRKGHYRDEGKPVAKIVSVVDALQAIVAIVLQRPNDARGRPRDYIRDTTKYVQVFGDDRYSLTLYLKAYGLCRLVSEYLDSLDIDSIHRRNIYFYLCMYVSCELTGSSYAIPKKLEVIDLSALTRDRLDSAYKRVFKQYELVAKRSQNNGEKDYDSVGRGPNLVKAITVDLKRRLNPKKAK